MGTCKHYIIDIPTQTVQLTGLLGLATEGGGAIGMVVMEMVDAVTDSANERGPLPCWASPTVVCLSAVLLLFSNS